GGGAGGGRPVVRPPPLPGPEDRPNLDDLNRRVRLLGCLLPLLVFLPLCVCAPLPVAFLFYGEIIWWLYHEPFEPAAWKEADEGERHAMAWGLRSGLLDKTPEEVVELLGEPMEKEDAPDEGEIWYHGLGPEKYQLTFGPAEAVLAVKFIEGRVVRVWKARR